MNVFFQNLSFDFYIGYRLYVAPIVAGVRETAQDLAFKRFFI